MKGTGAGRVGAAGGTEGAGEAGRARVTRAGAGRRTGVVRARIALAAVLTAALASACSGPSSSDADGAAAKRPAEPAHGKQAHGKPAPANAAPGKPAQGQPKAAGARAGEKGTAGALAAYVERVRKSQAARVAAAKKWGLAKTPLPAPPPPTVKPKINTRKGFETDGEGLPPVFTTVPTKEKIVFLTIDDGAEKDPELLRMMSDLQIPYSAFLSDYLVKEDYGYFKKMQDSGVSLHNHTLNHRYMPGLSYAQQKHEICDQQANLEKRYGKRPPLFRPPYGNYNEDTLRAAQSCGVKAVPLWAAEAFPDRMEWREWDRDLHPGDIVLTHFRGKEDWKGTMPDMIRRVMKTITDKGYAVAKLEDYV